MNHAPIRYSDAHEIDPKGGQKQKHDLSAAQARKLAELPVRIRPIFRRAWAGKSRKAAMRAHCLECCGYESAEVGRCTGATCALYPYRGGGK